MSNTEFLVYFSSSKNCYENLVLEETIVKNNCFDKDVVLLYQNANTVVIGKNQNIYEEINFAVAEELKVDYFRRLSGGGAVYQDLGNLCFAFITQQGRSYESFSVPIIEFLRSLGKIEVRFEGRNDILVNGAKVSGSAQFIHKNFVCHHGTLLYDVNLQTLAQVLRPNLLKLESKGIKSVRQRVVNIKSELGEEAPKSTEVFGKKLCDFFVKKGAKLITEKEIEQIKISENYKETLKKRQSREWIFGFYPKFTVENAARFEGGFVKVGFDIEDNKIVKIRITGDFLSTHGVSEVEEKLTNIGYEPQTILETLKDIQLSKFLGTIKAEELTDLLMLKTK